MTGRFKLASNLFLGLQELQHFYDFLADKTLLLKNTYSFGIVKSKDDINFDEFRVQAGTNAGTIKIISDSYALDSNGNIIYISAFDNLAIPDTNTYYWVKIAYLASPIEEGLVSIDNQGNLTGVGTKFTECLRGTPNHNSRIKFTDGSLNVQECLVQEIISDTSAILLGNFISEINLHYAVVGTFTPGVSIPSGDKYLFQYDSCIPLTVAGGGLVAEVSTNVAPSKTAGEEFYIARVKRNGASITIEDKRTEFYQTKADYDLSRIDTAINPLIGVESIKYDNQYSTLDHNEITIGWGMRSNNWTVNTELRRITLVSCVESGKFKTVANFTNDDFDNWRVYAKNGTYKKIISSTLSGGQINLILDSLDPDDYTASDELIIVPDVEEIQLKFKYDAASTVIGNVEIVENFPISQGYAAIKILIPASSGVYKYNVTYRYKNFASYSLWTTLPTDTANGYYDETSYDINGVLEVSIGDRNRKTYTTHATNGYIEFISNTSNYYSVVSGLTTGDVYGVEHVNLNDVDKHPVYALTVGASKQVQIFEGSNSLAVDWFISLVDGLKEENEFYLVFNNTITLGAFHLRIVENYVSTSVYDELLDFSAFHVAQAILGNLTVKCTWDGTNWVVFPIISSSPAVDITGKADKVTGAVNGNFAGLDAAGNLTDSGHKHADYDAAGAASTAQSNAEGYADGLIAGYGDIVTHNASEFEVAGAVAGLVSSLGDAAYKDTGTTTGTVAAGDDSRLSDAREIKDIAGVTLHTKIIEIGDWNMDSTDFVNIAHGVDYSKIISVQAIIKNDLDSYSVNLAGTSTGGLGMGSIYTYATYILLARMTSGYFDHTDYDSVSYNRGYILIQYTT